MILILQRLQARAASLPAYHVAEVVRMHSNILLRPLKSLVVSIGVLLEIQPLGGAVLTGEVVDAATGKPLAARVYIQSSAGEWHFVESSASTGSAVRHDRVSFFDKSRMERHTTLSAHPFKAELPAGDYTITVERGKEYHALSQNVTVGLEPVSLRLPIERWIDMSALGWYSGDTHVHRDPAEIPNVQLAEDVNAVHPMVHWTTVDDQPPARSAKSFQGPFRSEPVLVDATHVYYPLNTEYEIFTTGKKQHTLGAILIVGHRTPFDMPVFPLSRVLEKARTEGALLDLEKHNWPWSMALVPLLGVDLYELANNHHWRIEYTVKGFADPAPAWMGLSGSGSDTERDWTLYGFLNYYALLDCGYRLRPTAGTANGVHPVPRGYGRVYVHSSGAFSHKAWLEGLNAGRSFVTTGPMLLCEVDGRLPGARVDIPSGKPRRVQVRGRVVGDDPVDAIEIVVNGSIVKRIEPRPAEGDARAFETELREEIDLSGTSWLAVRAWDERGGGRLRFAHTAPWWFDDAARPIRPRAEEIRFLVERVRGEISRSEGLLPAEAVAEYRKALAAYEAIEASLGK